MFEFSEIVEILGTILLLGFIFEQFLQNPYLRRGIWERILIASLILSPAVVLHELAHKFVALHFNCSAVYNMYFPGLAIGVVLKLLRSPILFFIPAYVSISGQLTRNAIFWISIAGPLTNLLIYLVARVTIHRMEGERAFYTYLVSRVNLYLFLFNLLPIPYTDGYQALSTFVR
ncbi:MAG: hypothetical protein QW507_01895 [Candidatus Nanoarchaeia archaeon]|nr:hypothetical protein [Candidatus Haiyanarchaeum thermophilum]MCW1302833.1 hypothetical protein [Candidatus Haiyanarchaeum thermophilum]MCW1303514.1 hypothetical protein [Candidatus Haiyanarchaeum thermophilum]MCW1306694.1 hypothetical protein [Candidatus Haiyanarchaeum thermophilum]MCW1307350.1 hypothetical protein [Candidatus Haiyanarchaeum thermophilum]